MSTEFAYPWVLLGLLLVPALAVYLYLPRLRRARRGTFVFPGASILAGNKRGWRRYLEPVPDGLKLLAFALIVVALARPQAVSPEEVEVEGIDIYLVLDMSGSMLAIDLEPAELRALQRRGEQPLNRFDSAIETLKGFVESRTYDRLGMVVFARDAYLQFPLTLDRSTILTMLDRLRLGDIDWGGTAIGNAVGRAVAGLKESEAETKILILITDGDRRGGNISPKQAAAMAEKLGIRIYPILVGKEGTTLVPAGRDLFSGRTSYQRMEFPVNPELLQEMAATTGGRYYRAADGEGLRQDLHEILDEFERSRITDASNVDRRELFGSFVVAALLLLALQFALQYTLLRTFP